MKQEDMDKIYREVPLSDVPWNFETPPDALIALVKSKKIRPCKTVDLGCGAGTNAIYLASEGFEIIGLDISASAISIAKENANNKKIKCTFYIADVLGNMDEFRQSFDFAYDWELLHHIFPEKREIYVQNVRNILKPKGKYLSVCFNENDSSFGGSGKYRKTKLGTLLYFSSLDELKTLFERYFEVKESKIIEIRGKPVSHVANYILMELK
jgi:SAM-dependent methyltransferase